MPKATENLERLHTALNYFCPDGRAQAALTAIRRDAQAAEEPANRIAIMLMAAVLDGLQYDNWPRVN